MDGASLDGDRFDRRGNLQPRSDGPEPNERPPSPLPPLSAAFAAKDDGLGKVLDRLGQVEVGLAAVRLSAG